MARGQIGRSGRSRWWCLACLAGLLLSACSDGGDDAPRATEVAESGVAAPGSADQSPENEVAAADESTSTAAPAGASAPPTLVAGEAPVAPELGGQPAGGGRTDAIKVVWANGSFVAFRGLRYDAAHIIELWRSDDGETWIGPITPELPGGQIFDMTVVDGAFVMEVVGPDWFSGKGDLTWTMWSDDLEQWRELGEGLSEDIAVPAGLVAANRVRPVGSSGWFVETVGVAIDPVLYPGQVTFRTGDSDAYEFREAGGEWVTLAIPDDVLAFRDRPLVWRLSTSGPPSQLESAPPATPHDGDAQGLVAVRSPRTGIDRTVWFSDDDAGSWRQLDLSSLDAPDATALWPSYEAGNLYVVEGGDGRVRLHVSTDLGVSWGVADFDGIDTAGSWTAEVVSGPAGVAVAVGAPAPTILFADDGVRFRRLADPGPGESTSKSALATLAVGDDEVLYSISRPALPVRIPLD